MWKLIARRLLQFPIVIFVVYTVTFLLISAAPGDPLIGGDVSKVPPEVLEKQRERYGLDQSWHARYVKYGRAVLEEAWQGRIQLGWSIYYKGKEVADILGLTPGTVAGGAFVTSLTLGLLALALAVFMGVNLGVWAGARQNRLADHVTMGISVVGVSLPPFVTGAFLILLVAMALPLFPVGGWGSLSQMVLPALTLSLPYTAYIARLMRAGMVDTLSADYIRTGRAKGLSERRVVYKHAFKLSFLPVVSFLGPAAAGILTGSFVVERLFWVPGLGQHFVLGVQNRDQPVIIATVLLYAVLLVTFNLLVDIVYLVLDPRISAEEAV